VWKAKNTSPVLSPRGVRCPVRMSNTSPVLSPKEVKCPVSLENKSPVKGNVSNIDVNVNVAVNVLSNLGDSLLVALFFWLVLRKKK
jgi:hypothetical protein